jgi:prophage tail gpP-like protein
VQGWRQSNDALWKPNLVVTCKIPPLYVDQDLIIAEVNYVLNESGTACRMTLKRPDAFNTSNLGKKVKAQKKAGFDAFN